MAGHRRKWLIVTVLLAIVAALAWALLGRDGRMDVQLVFVGYTNRIMEAKPPPGETSPLSFPRLKAIVFATNSGQVPVEFYPAVRLANCVLTGTAIQYREGFAAPSRPVASRVLQPGETIMIEVGEVTFQQPWFTELMAQRRCLSDRIYCKAWDSGNAKLQGIMKRWLPALPEVWAKLGPITNPPPDMEPSMMEAWKKFETITKPLPDIESVLDSMKPQPPRRPSPSLLDGGTYR